MAWEPNKGHENRSRSLGLIKPQVVFNMQLQVAMTQPSPRPNFQPMVESDNFDIGATLNQLIARSTQSKVALAEHLGVSPQAVQKWVNQGSIAREHIRSICQFLDCSADELFGLVPMGSAPLSQSQSLEIDTEMLKSAIVAVKEALKAMGLELDAFLAAPMIAYAYAERMDLPRLLTKEEYHAFDVLVTAKLRGELGHGKEAGQPIERGAGSSKAAQASGSKDRARGQTGKR